MPIDIIGNNFTDDAVILSLLDELPDGITEIYSNSIRDKRYEDMKLNADIFTPYKIIETLSGIYFKEKFTRMPLVGYETDNLFRVVSVSFLNFISEYLFFL